MNFWRVLDVLNKRKWLILFSVVVTTALTWGATRLVGSRWEATVSFVIPPTAAAANLNGAPSGGELEGQQGNSIGKAKAQMYTLWVRSAPVVGPALAKCGVTSPPPDLLSRIEFISTSGRLYELHVSDPNPAFAEKLANALADQLVAKLQEVNSQKAGTLANELEGQFQAVDTQLKAAQDKKIKFADKKEIVTELNRDREMAIQRYQAALFRRDDTTSKIAADEAGLAVKEAELKAMPLTRTNETLGAPNLRVKSLRDALANAESQLKSIGNRYTEEHPTYKAALRDRDQAKEELDQVLAATKPSSNQIPNPERIVAMNQISAIRQQISSYRAGLASVNLEISDAEAKLNMIKTTINPMAAIEAEISQLSDKRTNLVNRLYMAKDAKDKAERQTEIVIMDRSGELNPPVNATAGRSKKVILLALFCSLIGSAGLAIGLDSIDRRLRSVNEAEIVLPARILAAIPQPMGSVTYSTLARATELQPQSLHSEAYRFLGLHLLNSHSNIRSLMVLSAKAEQGSTTTITNLAITLAQAGKRVIIVDANVRTAELHQVFETSNDFGFADLITSPDADAWEKAVKPTSTPNLSVITSGNRPDNPWEMFRSPHLRELSNKLREMADYVLYDTPSALIFTDALNLAPVVDAAFMCVRAYEPLTGAEQRLIDLLKEAGVPVLGSVLNDVPASVVEGYHNYQHYYAPAITAGDGEPTPIATGVARPIVEVTKSSRNGHGNDGPSLS